MDTNAEPKRRRLGDAILVLGDGDLTFSRALARHDASLRIYATEIGTAPDLSTRYFNGSAQQTEARLAELRALSVRVALGIDGTKLDVEGVGAPEWLRPHSKRFDRVVFNFPHSYRHGGTAKVVKACFASVQRSGVLDPRGRFEMRMRSLSPKEDARYGYAYESARRRGWCLEAVLPCALLAALAERGYAHTQTKRSTSALDAHDCRPLLWRWRLDERIAAAGVDASAAAPTLPLPLPCLLDRTFRDAALLPLALDHRRVDAALHLPCPCTALLAESRRRAAQAAAAAARGAAAGTGSSSGRRRRLKNGPIDELVAPSHSRPGAPCCWCVVPSDTSDALVLGALGVDSGGSPLAAPAADAGEAALLKRIDEATSGDEMGRRLAMWRLLKRTVARAESNGGDGGAAAARAALPALWRALGAHYRRFSAAHEHQAQYCEHAAERRRCEASSPFGTSSSSSSIAVAS